MLDNYFKLLGLEISYDVDMSLLKANYLDLQRTVHPDKFAHASDLDRRLSVQKAAQINDAFQTLKNPLKRAVYQLSLSGVEIKDNETAMEPAFLMEQMELREKLAGIKQQAEPFDALDQMIAEVETSLRAFQTHMSKLFSEASAEALQQAKTNVLKMQFLSRLQEECLNLEEELANEF